MEEFFAPAKEPLGAPGPPARYANPPPLNWGRLAQALIATLVLSYIVLWWFCPVGPRRGLELAALAAALVALLVLWPHALTLFRGPGRTAAAPAAETEAAALQRWWESRPA